MQSKRVFERRTSEIHLNSIELLETTPKWLSLTFGCTACLLIVVGIGIVTDQLFIVNITLFTTAAHFVLALSLSAWILNLRIRLTAEKKSLLALGLVAAVGSMWTSLQQWFGYLQTGLPNDIVLIATATVMDLAGGCATLVLYRLTVLKKIW